MYLKDYYVQILQLGQNGQQTVKTQSAGSIFLTKIFHDTTTLIKIAGFEHVTPCSLVQAYLLHRHTCYP
jgi:hypothetical protein